MTLEMPHDRWMSLQLKSSWWFRLGFESPMPEAAGYGWDYRHGRMAVTKGGQPFAATDGDRELRIGGRLFRAAPKRVLAESEWLRADGVGFTLHWGVWCGARSDAPVGVRIAVDGSPDERYLARVHAPRWRIGLRTHVSVEALEGKADVDRMVALLAYFWTDARARHAMAG